MVALNLSDEQREFQKLAREFSQRELEPKGHQFDKSGEYPAELLNKVWETGLLNVEMPDELGGLALSTLDSCVIAEELAAGCSGIAGFAETSSIAQIPVLLFGTEEQKRKFLGPLADDSVCVAYATSLLEIKRGSQIVPHTGFRYVERDGSFELEGEGILLNAHSADWFVIAAESQAESINGGGSTRPVSLFIIATETEGMKLTGDMPSLGRKCLKSTRVELSSVRVDRDHLIGRPGAAAEMLPQFAARAYLLIAAGCVGVARAAMEHAIMYAKQRHTFGRPIAQHQAVAFMISDMAKDIEAARLMVYQACRMIQQGVHAFDEAGQSKLFAQEMVMRVTTDAVQVFGGYGYSKEYPVEKLMRDAKAYQMAGGTNQEQATLVGRRALAEATA